MRCFTIELFKALDAPGRPREERGMGGRHSWKRWAIGVGAVAALMAAMFFPKPVLGPAQRPNAGAPTAPPVLLAGDPAASLSPSASQKVTVYVCGAVNRPDVYTLAAGSRVVDAIAKAGGALPQARVEELNLAAPLTDAMKVAVPAKGQRSSAAERDDVSQAASPAAADSGQSSGLRRIRGASRGRRSASAAHKLRPGQSLNVNEAGVLELASLPGVGPSLARRIVDYRAQNGPFQTVDDLQNVAGIGPSKFEKMQGYIRL
ncbi:MAG: helix-hairpin-helix domain-containing protein [Candidatus Eremiobacteraeota bacterium]|nr:helix-hairpin-helix domain-containing protein [Candidatus Eremiobacteraeota bacterium]